jgi:hypothetical protein
LSIVSHHAPPDPLAIIRPRGNSRDMEKPKFARGQNVTMRQSRFHRAPNDTFEIVRSLPAERGDRQYRIKSLRDGHERVAMESALE